MKRSTSIILIAAGLLAGCSSGGTSTGTSSKARNSAIPTTTATANGVGTSAACSGGVQPDDPGVVSVTCDGSAEIKIKVGNVSKDLHGGVCHSVGNVWSASVGVVVDATGMHGTYTGPSVDDVAVNNTDAPGKATVQSVIAGKKYFALGDAHLTLAGDKLTAHVTATSDRQSDAPGTPIVVDVTCGALS